MKLPVARKVTDKRDKRRRRLPNPPARVREVASSLPRRLPSLPGSSKVRVGLLAGLASGLLAAVIAVLARRARRRAERRNAEFARASEGLWPEVAPDSDSDLRIATEQAGTGTEPAAEERLNEAGEPTPVSPGGPAAEPTGDGAELRVIEGGAESA